MTPLLSEYPFWHLPDQVGDNYIWPSGPWPSQGDIGNLPLKEAELLIQLPDRTEVIPIPVESQYCGMYDLLLAARYEYAKAYSQHSWRGRLVRAALSVTSTRNGIRQDLPVPLLRQFIDERARVSHSAVREALYGKERAKRSVVLIGHVGVGESREFRTHGPIELVIPRYLHWVFSRAQDDRILHFQCQGVERYSGIVKQIAVISGPGRVFDSGTAATPGHLKQLLDLGYKIDLPRMEYALFGGEEKTSVDVLNLHIQLYKAPSWNTAKFVVGRSEKSLETWMSGRIPAVWRIPSGSAPCQFHAQLPPGYSYEGILEGWPGDVRNTVPAPLWLLIKTSAAKIAANNGVTLNDEEMPNAGQFAREYQGEMGDPVMKEDLKETVESMSDVQHRGPMKEDKTVSEGSEMTDGTAMDKFMQSLKDLGGAAGDGLGMAVTDQTGEFFLNAAKKMFKDFQFLDPMLQSQDGREATKLIMAALTNIAVGQAGSFMKLPPRAQKIITKITKYQTQASFFKLFGPRMGELRQFFELLAGFGESMGLDDSDEEMQPKHLTSGAERARTPNYAESVEQD